MKTAHHRFAVAILALLVLPVPAWGADPIKAELDAARKVYADALYEAREAFKRTCSVRLKKIAETGNLDDYKDFEAAMREVLEGKTVDDFHPMYKHMVAYHKKRSE